MFAAELCTCFNNLNSRVEAPLRASIFIPFQQTAIYFCLSLAQGRAVGESILWPQTVKRGDISYLRAVPEAICCDFCSSYVGTLLMLLLPPVRAQLLLL